MWPKATQGAKVSLSLLLFSHTFFFVVVIFVAAAVAASRENTHKNLIHEPFFVPWSLRGFFSHTHIQLVVSEAYVLFFRRSLLLCWLTREGGGARAVLLCVEGKFHK